MQNATEKEIPTRVNSNVGKLADIEGGSVKRARALAAGYEMHIPKPFVAAELISAAIFLTDRHSRLA